MAEDRQASGLLVEAIRFPARCSHPAIFYATFGDEREEGIGKEELRG
jgi:hypothetical protein